MPCVRNFICSLATPTSPYDMIKLSRKVRTSTEYTNITCPNCGWTQKQNLSKPTQHCKKCQQVNKTQYPYVGG